MDLDWTNLFSIYGNADIIIYSQERHSFTVNEVIYSSWNNTETNVMKYDIRETVEQQVSVS